MAERQRTTTDPGHEAPDPLGRRIREMSRTRGSSVEMCHAQGKTAVYLSDDGLHLISHQPNGTIAKKRLHSPGNP